MMTFSQYLEERKLGAYALAGIVGGIGLGSTPRPQVKQPVQISARTEEPAPQPTQQVTTKSNIIQL
jgi:hypothetical protein